jgi:hypothetical protein
VVPPDPTRCDSTECDSTEYDWTVHDSTQYDRSAIHPAVKDRAIRMIER